MTPHVWRHDGIGWRWVREGSLYDTCNQEHTERARLRGEQPPEREEAA